uniref:protein-tyrosine-phosphatase n=1 Tax=Dunaliella tertiolecta TaxID=3047 RepID=A0A7S3RAN6_DUNTE
MTDPCEQPLCKSNTLYNFGPATNNPDNQLYGSARPGAQAQRCYNPNDVVTVKEVEEFAKFMKPHGIQHAVGLLSESEIATFERPPSQVLKQQGIHATNFDLKSFADEPALAKEVLAYMRARASGQKVLVYCWGGGSRSARILAFLLVALHSFVAEEAIKQVCRAPGTNRMVTPEQLQALLA